MDVEKARVTGRAERLNAQAASFLTGRTNDVAERLFHGALVSRARMKTSEDEQLQASSEVSLHHYSPPFGAGQEAATAPSMTMMRPPSYGAWHRGNSPPAVDPAQLDLPAGLTGSTGDLATTPSGREVSDPDARHDKLASAGGRRAAPCSVCPLQGLAWSTHPPALQWIGTVERERQDVRSEKRRRRIVEFLIVVGVVALAFFVWFGCRRSAPMTRSSPPLAQTRHALLVVVVSVLA